MRYYKVTKFSGPDDKVGTILGIFPSITTVLSQTANKIFLKKWEKKIGEENAKRITENAAKRGNVMHRLCEIYLGLPNEMSNADKLETTLQQSITDKEINSFDTRSIIVGGMLFYNYIRANSFAFIKENIYTECFMWTDKHGGFAGTIDNVSMMFADEEHGEHEAIIDFKTSLKPKEDEWIEDYKLQVSAYAVMLFHRKGIKIKKAHIMISNEITHIPQIFTLSIDELNYYYKEFRERLNKFYEKFPPISIALMNAENDLF